MRRSFRFASWLRQYLGGSCAATDSILPWAATAAVLLALQNAACSRPSQADSAPPAATVSDATDTSTFTVQHPEQFPLVAVEIRQLPDQLNVPGVVAPDITRAVHVESLSGGRVVEIRAKLGDDVRKGQTLVVIHSMDLAAAINAYQKSVADELLTRKALDRAQNLYAHGAVALKGLQQAEDDEQKARLDMKANAQQVRIMGGDLQRLTPVIEVKAPISGTIVEQNTSGGEAVKSVDNSPSLFTITDLSRVWILCTVYENDLSKVHVGDAAAVRLNGYPGRILHGTVSNISSILDPNTRTAMVRVDLANPQRIMKPQMFATVTLVSRKKFPRTVIPASALFRLHDRYWVFVPQQGSRFRRIEVQTGQTLGDSQEVLAGLQPGRQVVANALQFSSAVEMQ